MFLRALPIDAPDIVGPTLECDVTVMAGSGNPSADVRANVHQLCME